MAQEQRIDHTVKNIIWTYIYIGIGTIFPFILRSLIIRFWGMEYLGVNSLFSAILQVLNVSELGIGQALVINMYRPAAERDTGRINSLLSLYAWFYRVLGIGIGVIGLVLVPFVPQIISGEYPQEINIFVVYIVYLFQSVVSYLAFPYCNAAFIANQCLEKTNKYQSIVWAVVYVIQIVVICYCNNYYYYVFLLPVATFLCGIVNKWGLKKWFPEYHVGKIKKSDFEKSFWQTFAKRMLATAMSKLRVVFRSSIDTIIISAVLGIAVAAKYQNYVLVMTVPLMLIGSLTTGILPTLGNSVALETKESNLAVIRLVAFLIHWISTIFAAFLICFYQPFTKIWAGDEGLLSETAMIMFVVYFYIRAISEISILVRNSSGVWWEGKWVSIMESLVNLGLNILFVQIWGVEGIVLATIISMMVLNIPFETFYVYKYYFKIAPWRDLLEYLWDAIVSLIAVAVTYFVSRLYQRGVADTFIVWCVVCVIIPNVVLFLFHCRNKKLAELIEIGMQAVRKNKFI